MPDETSLSKSLQHPRRSLGNRYRSQAEKFLKIAGNDPRNLVWGEQSARQSVLYDFTNEENWKVLIRSKLIAKDYEGSRAVLADLFSVLGRDPELIGQLDRVEIIDTYEDLLLAAIDRDPLDPDKWWEKIQNEDIGLSDFSERLRGLDVSDQRANILFSRRLERVRKGGHEDLFLDLSRHLLAHRPNNHEAWEELGRMHERRGDFDEAWLCYDQSQTVFPDSTSRDRFKQRMSDRFVQSEGAPWKEPPIQDRANFQDKLRSMASKNQEDGVPYSEDDKGLLGKVSELRNSGNVTEAFFIARRMMAEGDDSVSDLVEELIGEMDV